MRFNWLAWEFPAPGAQRTRSDGDVKSQGSADGRAQVLAAYAVQPGRLTSLARRGNPAESRGHDLSRGSGLARSPEKARVPSKVRGRWWLLRSVLVRQHQGQSRLRVVNVERAASGNQFYQLGGTVVVANIQGHRQAVGVAVAAEDGKARHPNQIP